MNIVGFRWNKKKFVEISVFNSTRKHKSAEEHIWLWTLLVALLSRYTFATIVAIIRVGDTLTKT